MRNARVTQDVDVCDADLDNDSAVGIPDFTILVGAIGGTPGPSRPACAGTPPCP